MGTADFIRYFLIWTVLVAGPVWASGGGEAAPAAGAGEASSKEAKEFREQSAKLAGFEVKITEMNKIISELIEKKRHTKDGQTVRDLMKELVKVSADRNKMVKDHTKLKQYLLYRFPNLGESVTRRYGVHEEMSVEDLERTNGLDKLLTEVKSAVDKKYAPGVSRDTSTDPHSPQMPVDPPAEEQPLRLVK